MFDEGHSYGEEVSTQHVVRQVLQHAVQPASVRNRDLLPSTIIPAAPIQSRVIVVSIVRHCV